MLRWLLYLDLNEPRGSAMPARRRLRLAVKQARGAMQTPHIFAAPMLPCFAGWSPSWAPNPLAALGCPTLLSNEPHRFTQPPQADSSQQ